MKISKATLSALSLALSIPMTQISCTKDDSPIVKQSCDDDQSQHGSCYCLACGMG